MGATGTWRFACQSVVVVASADPSIRALFLSRPTREAALLFVDSVPLSLAVAHRSKQRSMCLLCRKSVLHWSRPTPAMASRFFVVLLSPAMVEDRSVGKRLGAGWVARRTMINARCQRC